MKILKFLSILLLIPSLCFGAGSWTFDGTGDNATFGTNETINSTSPFTLIAWLNLPSFVDAFPAIAVLNENSTTVDCWRVGWSNNASWLDVFIGSGTSAGWFTGQTGSLGGVSGTGWRRFAVTYNGSAKETAGNFAVFLDNTKDTTFTARSAGDINTSTNSIGGTATNTSFDWNGRIAYFQLHGATLLSDSLIAQEHWLPGSSGDGMTQFLPFWGASPENNLASGTVATAVNQATTSTDGPPAMFGGGLPL